jgi:tetratricopeptide (TPR) repeat protein
LILWIVVLTTAVCVSAITLPFQSGGQRRSAYAQAKRAHQLYGDARYEEALKTINSAIRKIPDYAYAHNLRGYILLKQERYEEALAAADKAIMLEPDQPEHLVLRGVVNQHRHDYEASIKDYTRLLRLKPSDPTALTYRAYSLAQLEKTEEAFTDVQEALALDERNMYGHQLAAKLCIDLGLPDDKVLEHYGRAIELDPSNALSYSGRAPVLLRTGRSEEALADIHKAIELDRANPYVLPAYGYILGELARYDEAEEVLREAVALDPENAYALNGLAWHLATVPEAGRRDGDEAVELAEKALEQAGTRPPALLDTLAAAYAEAGRFAEAVRTEEEALAATKSDYEREHLLLHLNAFKNDEAWIEPADGK